MRYLRGIWNVLFLAAGARFGYVLYTDPAARVTAKEWLVWLGAGGLFREASAAEIVQNVILVLGIVAFLEAVWSSLTYLARWFIRATPPRRCPSCNHVIQFADKFCAHCGSPIRPQEGLTAPTARSTHQAKTGIFTTGDINPKSPSNMVGLGVIILLVSIFAFFWFVRNTQLAH